jgi:hypothetical protein
LLGNLLLIVMRPKEIIFHGHIGSSHLTRFFTEPLEFAVLSQSRLVTSSSTPPCCQDGSYTESLANSAEDPAHKPRDLALSFRPAKPNFKNYVSRN